MSVSGLFRIFFGIALTAASFAQHTSVAQATNATRRLSASNNDSTIMQACERMANATSWARGWACTPATYFTDNKTQRRSIPELRRRRQRDPKSLTEEDHAILHAANRIGMLAFNGCKNPEHNGSVTANAFLIRIDERDAVVTSLHQLFGKREEGWRMKNDCSYDELSRDIVYFPNASYIEGDNGPPGTYDKISVVPHPVSEEHVKAWVAKGRFRGAKNVESDWMIYLLPEQITDRPAPDGYIRGFSRPSSRHLGLDYVGYTLGFDPRFSRETGVYSASYQRCAFGDLNGQTWHSCNVAAGSSSSLMGTLEGGEIRFRAMQNLGGFEGDSSGGEEGTDIPVPIGLPDRNSGLSYETIEAEASVEFDHDWGQRPDLLAHDIQWALFRAGCYAGKLDNQWGSASRKALADFNEHLVLAIPATEPSDELLAALEAMSSSVKCD